MKWWSRLLVGVLAGVMVCGVAVAQTGPVRIVQGSDGSVYLLKDGARFLIAVDPIDDDELSGYADGGTLGSGDLVAALGSTTAAVAAPAAPNAASESTPATPQPAAGAGTSRSGVPTLNFIKISGAAPGGTAGASVQTTPGASCNLVYRTPAGTLSSAAGLGAKTSDASGVAAWSWLIDGNTRPGLGNIDVTCGNLGVHDIIQIGSVDPAKR